MPQSKKSLKGSVEDLFKRYKEEGVEKKFSDPQELEAYALYRSPATQAALRRVLSSTKEISFETALELGSGPGSSYPVLQDLFVKKIVYIEKEQGFYRDLPNVSWIFKDYTDQEPFPASDLVLFSYTLSEIEKESQKRVLQKAVDAVQKRLVILEPGTPKGFATILRARDFFIEQGLTIHAPCFHSGSCPKKDSGWCHFSVRLARSKIHRQIKGATLGYEDEKYSYIIVSKEKAAEKKFTILETPKIEKHRITIQICTDEGKKILECKSQDKQTFKFL